MNASPNALDVEVSHRAFLAPNILDLRLDRRGIDFCPGDCVSIFLPDGGSRPYSIASGTADPYLRFLIRVMPGGEVTGWLATLAVGATVRISRPYGWFRPFRSTTEKEAAVLVATGTGISPFISALRSYPDVPVRILYGVRTLADAVERDYIASRAPLSIAVSRERPDGCHHGRVTELLRAIPVGDNTHYYLCGIDAMIDDATSWLTAAGVPHPRIHREVFFNA